MTISVMKLWKMKSKFRQKRKQLSEIFSTNFMILLCKIPKSGKSTKSQVLTQNALKLNQFCLDFESHLLLYSNLTKNTLAFDLNAHNFSLKLSEAKILQQLLEVEQHKHE
jgi:hypothetical protein